MRRRTPKTVIWYHGVGIDRLPKRSWRDLSVGLHGGTAAHLVLDRLEGQLDILLTIPMVDIVVDWSNFLIFDESASECQGKNKE